jgi:pSer/pThr/pTyr-binding forkhead associated (FHA) protein
MDKLAIYFLSQGSSRVLDVEQQPARTGVKSGVVTGWTVGRLPTCDIAWSPARNPDYAMVSKRHALIQATPSTDITEGGTRLYKWAIIDMGEGGRGSSNGTHLSSQGKPAYRLQPGIPYAIGEGDRIQFGCSAATVKVSFDIDETSSGLEDDPPTGLHHREDEASAPTPGPWFVGSILRPVWDWFTAKGPHEQFVWFVLIGAAAAAILYILER